MYSDHKLLAPCSLNTKQFSAECLVARLALPHGPITFLLSEHIPSPRYPPRIRPSAIMWASDLNQVRTQPASRSLEQLSVRLSPRVSECCRPHCRKPLSRQPTLFQHGARRFASGRPRQQNQTCYGRRRAEEYEEYDEDQYEEAYEQAVAPDEPISPPPQRSFPVFVAIPGIMLLAFTLFRIVKKIQGRG